MYDQVFSVHVFLFSLLHFPLKTKPNTVIKLNSWGMLSLGAFNVITSYWEKKKIFTIWSFVLVCFHERSKVMGMIKNEKTDKDKYLAERKMWRLDSCVRTGFWQGGVSMYHSSRSRQPSLLWKSLILPFSSNQHFTSQFAQCPVVPSIIHPFSVTNGTSMSINFDHECYFELFSFWFTSFGLTFIYNEPKKQKKNK